MFVYRDFQLRHHILVVVLQADDPRSGCADLRDVDVCSGEAVEGGEAGVHVDAMLEGTWLACATIRSYCALL